MAVNNIGNGVSLEGVTVLSGLQIGSGVPTPYGPAAGQSIYTGSPIYAQSFTSYLGVAMVVQGSASSFTVVPWTAAKRGGFIQVTPLGAGVSSLSSGIVLHSHCTQDGHVEVRMSNVSTLAQNVSAISWGLFQTVCF